MTFNLVGEDLDNPAPGGTRHAAAFEAHAAAAVFGVKNGLPQARS
jgi:hypothetical protein